MKTDGIFIIIPPDDSFREINTAVPSLGVAVLSNYLETNGFATEVLDLAREVWLSPEKWTAAEMFGDSRRVMRYLEGHPDDEIDSATELLFRGVRLRDGLVCAFSLDLMPNFTKYGSMLCMAKFAKQKCDCTTVIGGLLYPEGLAELLQYDFIDYGVASLDLYSFCGHHPLLQLCIAIHKQIPDPSSIPGLISKQNGRLISTPPEDAETFFPPSFRRFQLDLYRVKIPESFASRCEDRILVLPYRFSAGCPRNCGFCYNSRFRENKRLASDVIIGQIERLVSDTGCRHFLFLNPCVNITPAFSKEFADALIEAKLKISWSDCAMFEGLDEATLELFASAGCKRLYFGFESLTRNIKAYANKQLKLSHIKRVLEACADLSIWVGLDIITGFPHETRKEMGNVALFLARNSHLVDSVTVNEFKIYRHTGFHSSPEKYGIRLRDQETSSLRDAFGLQFDETGGRLWEDIGKDTKWGAELMKRAFESAHGYSNDSEMLPLLFGIYEKMSAKKDVRPVYRDLVAEYSKSYGKNEKGGRFSS